MLTDDNLCLNTLLVKLTIHFPDAVLIFSHKTFWSGFVNQESLLYKLIKTMIRSTSLPIKTICIAYWNGRGKTIYPTYPQAEACLAGLLSFFLVLLDSVKQSPLLWFRHVDVVKIAFCHMVEMSQSRKM